MVSFQSFQYGWIYQATVVKKSVFVFANSAQSNMVWILLYSNFLLLNTTILNVDWIRILTIKIGTISCNSVFLILYIHAVGVGQPFSKWYLSYFLIKRQNITSSSTNCAYLRSKINYARSSGCIIFKEQRRLLILSLKNAFDILELATNTQ